MANKQLNIGLFGFGVVGKGLYDVLHTTPTLQASIKKIVIKNADKKRSIAAEIFSTDAAVILNDESINVVVELIDDADAAFEIVKTALQKGKSVVSANKKMIAELERAAELEPNNETHSLLMRAYDQDGAEDKAAELREKLRKEAFAKQQAPKKVQRPKRVVV